MNARPEDKILLRCDALPPVASMEVKVDGTLTVMPDEDYHPVLLLLQDTRLTNEIHAALFRLTTGVLQFERLEFHVKPTIEGFESQAVVALIGDGSCAFSSCLITLETGTASTDARLAAATLTESSAVMRKPGGQPPGLTFQSCTVRGQGDLVFGLVARPLKFVAQNTIVALSGSLLALEVGLMTATATEGKVEVVLEYVTACLGGNLLNLKSLPKAVQVLQVVCAPKQCLFLPFSSEGVLVLVDGPDLDLEKQLQWGQGEANAYGVCGAYVAKQAEGQPTPILQGLDKWKAFIGDDLEKPLSKYRIALTNTALLDEGLASLKLRPMAERASEFGIPESDRQALVELFPQLLPPRIPESTDKE